MAIAGDLSAFGSLAAPPGHCLRPTRPSSKAAQSTLLLLMLPPLLDLSWTWIRTIPDSIISLLKLQTLNLGNCFILQRLPKGIIFLTRLRHLDIFRCYQLTGMPHLQQDMTNYFLSLGKGKPHFLSNLQIGQLTNLRTLPTFMVGEEQRERTIMELQHLNQIRGHLSIHHLERVKDGREAAMQANLAAKTGLQSLLLEWIVVKKKKTW